MLLHSLNSTAQMLVTDPALAAITLGNGIVQQQAHENIAQKPRAIETLQARRQKRMTNLESKAARGKT